MYGLRVLLDIHDTLNDLSEDQFLTWIHYLNSNSPESININSRFKQVAVVFRQLYESSNRNNVNWLQDLLDHAKNLKSKNKSMFLRKKNHAKKTQLEKNLFNTIPKDLLCYIATYLKIKQLFCVFNRICKESLRIATKPQSIQYWSLEYCDSIQFCQSTKYDIIPLLSDIKHLKCHFRIGRSGENPSHHKISWNSNIGCNSLPVTLNTNRLINMHDSTRVEQVVKLVYKQEVPINFKAHSDKDNGRQELNALKEILSKMVNLKHLVLNLQFGWRVSPRETLTGSESNVHAYDQIIANENALLLFLQTIAPLSSKEKEKEKENKIFKLKTQRFREKQTDVHDVNDVHDHSAATSCFVTPYISNGVLYEIKKDVGKSIINNIVDAAVKCNQLTYDTKLNPDNEYYRLEMIEFNFENYFGKSLRIKDNFSFLDRKFIKNCVKKNNRINNNFYNLKGFAFHSNYARGSFSRTDYGDGYFRDEVAFIFSFYLLNTIGNQLKSLHIDDQAWGSLECNTDATFVSIDGSINDTFETWYFPNVEEFCFTIHRCNWKDMFAYLSKFVTSKGFSKLKRLKCIMIVGERYAKIESTTNNLQQLIANGLESLHISMKNCFANELHEMLISKSILFDFSDAYDDDEESNDFHFSPKSNHFYFILNTIKKAIIAERSRITDTNTPKNSSKQLQRELFIVKIEMNDVIWIDTDACDVLKTKQLQDINIMAAEMMSLFEQLLISFRNPMLCFKLLVNVKSEIHHDTYQVETKIKDEIFEAIVTSIDIKVKERNVLTNARIELKRWNKSNHEVGIGITMTNKQGDTLCWADPTFEYKCCHCQPELWLE